MRFFAGILSPELALGLFVGAWLDSGFISRTIFLSDITSRTKRVADSFWADTDIERNRPGAIVLLSHIFIRHEKVFDNENVVLYSYLQFGHIAGQGA